jgi:hypothetical protein
VTRQVCRAAGVLLALIGALGMAAPHLLGLNLTPRHDLILCVTGVAIAWAGWAGTSLARRLVCVGSGLFYAVLAALGVILPGVLGNLIGRPGLSSTELRPDTVLHLVLALVCLMLAVPKSSLDLETLPGGT